MDVPESDGQDAQPPEAPPGRAAMRNSLFLGVEVERGGRRLQGRIRNISRTGALVELAVPLALGERLRLSFRGVPEIGATVLRQADKHVGVRFDTPIDPSVCIKSTAAPKLDWESDYAVNLREPYRPRW